MLTGTYQELADHPCYHARAYMAALKESHDSTELPLALKQHLMTASSPYSFRRVQGLQGALELLHKQPPCQHPGNTTQSSIGTTGGSMGSSVPTAASGAGASPLGTANYSSLTLQRAFPSRNANGIQADIAPAVKEVCPLSQDVLLCWTSLHGLPETFTGGGGGEKTAKKKDGAEEAKPNATTEEDDAQTLEYRERLAKLHHVTLQEQELALRVVQGLCVLYPDQRGERLADGSLIPVALEALCAYQQHLATVAEWEYYNPGSAATNTAAAGRSGSPPPASTTGAADAGAPISIPGPACPRSRLGASATQQLKVDQLRVCLAFIDALEAACHYSTHCVQTLVSLKGVPILLNLLTSVKITLTKRAVTATTGADAASNGDSVVVSRVPHELQRAVLHFFSMLTNETRCLDRIELVTRVEQEKKAAAAAEALASDAATAGGGAGNADGGDGAAGNKKPSLMGGGRLRRVGGAAGDPIFDDLAARERVLQQSNAINNWPNRASSTKFYTALHAWLSEAIVHRQQQQHGRTKSGGGGVPVPSATSSATATAVATAIKSLTQLVNFQGTSVPAGLSQAELQRVTSKLQTKREALMLDFLSQIGRR